ncbi:MAG: hypothetical protein ACREX4_11985 [Gammaproteobacteria bacterium]
MSSYATSDQGLFAQAYRAARTDRFSRYGTLVIRMRVKIKLLDWTILGKPRLKWIKLPITY